MKIALVGPYPPPMGGISIHIQRFSALLNADGQKVFIYKNISARKWVFSGFGKWYRFDIVHFHDIDWVNQFIVSLLSILGVSAVLTIHGDSLKNKYNASGWLKKKALGFIMRRIKFIYCVKSEIKNVLLALGVSPANISVVNAYLPPALDSNFEIADSTLDFLIHHSPIIAANGFEISSLSDSSDLYGVEMTMQVCFELQQDLPEIGFVFYLAQIGDQERYQSLQLKLEVLGIHNNFLFVIGENFIPALSEANIFIRPTFSDGYGVSVAEALYLGIPAIASDVCEREAGTVLFHTGDSQDLERKIRDMLGDYTDHKDRVRKNCPASSYPELIAGYKLLYSRHG